MRPSLPSSGSRFRSISDRAEGFLLWVFTILLLVNVLLGILARYIHFEVVFADELGKYLFIWLCTIGISAATRDDQHVRLTFIATHIPLDRKIIRLVSQLLFLIFALGYSYWSIRLTWMQFLMDKSVMGFRFPMYLFTAALPFGFALTSIRLMQDIVDILKSDKKLISTPDQNAIEE